MLNSSKAASNFLESVHTIANPKNKAKTKADITESTGGIFNLNIIGGSVFKPSTTVNIFNIGIIIYPESIENIAAPSDDRYANINIATNILLALAFIFVIAGAINPKIINGTVNEII